MNDPLIETKLDKELKEIEEIHNNQFYLYQIEDPIDDIHEKDIWESLKSKIVPHFDEFSQELEKYFSQEIIVSGLDIEGGTNPFLAVGITISNPREFEIWGKFPNNPCFFTGDDSVILKCKKELKNVVYPLVGYGVNGKEQSIFQYADVPIYDAQVIFNLCDSNHKTSGMHYAEEKIGLHRQACEFYKHKYLYRNFSFSAKYISQINKIQIYQSLWNHYRGAHQRTCQICYKPQDILLYCLEDALSAAFIYIYYQNRYPEKVSQALKLSPTKGSIMAKTCKVIENVLLMVENERINKQFYLGETNRQEYNKNFSNLLNKAKKEGHNDFSFFPSQPGIIEFQCEHCDLTLSTYGNMQEMKAENYINLEKNKREKIAEVVLPAIQEYYLTQTKNLEQEILYHPENSILFAGMIKQLEWMYKNVIVKQEFYNRIISKENYENLKKFMRENNIDIAKIPIFQSKILSEIIFFLNGGGHADTLNEWNRKVRFQGDNLV